MVSFNNHRVNNYRICRMEFAKNNLTDYDIFDRRRAGLKGS